MDFGSGGILSPGLHELAPQEFIESFCAGEKRAPFIKAIQDLCDFAMTRGATRILIGGSFVTKSATPNDLDCVIVFATDNQIPDRSEQLEIEGVRLDIFFCSEEQPTLLGAFVKLFAQTRRGRTTGIIQLKLWVGSKPLWDVIHEPDPRTLEIVKRVYFDRHLVDLNNRKKAIITVHGMLSHGEWGAEITHIGSSNGWIIAPFVYGYVQPTVLSNPSRRREIVDRFRAHLEDMITRYGCHVSVIAHSLGTYIVAAYLYGFDICPYSLDTLILTGSILNENLDISALRGKVARVINEIAPNDSTVKFARAASLWRDPLIGRSGEVGFLQQAPLLEQHTCDVFDHNNVIRRDVISRRWMPWLEAHVGRGSADLMKMMAERVRSDQEL